MEGKLLKGRATWHCNLATPPPRPDSLILKKLWIARSRLYQGRLCREILILQDLGGSRSAALVFTALTEDIYQHFLEERQVFLKLCNCCTKLVFFKTILMKLYDTIRVLEMFDNFLLSYVFLDFSMLTDEGRQVAKQFYAIFKNLAILTICGVPGPK